jgi:hypothetical protein
MLLDKEKTLQVTKKKTKSMKEKLSPQERSTRNRICWKNVKKSGTFFYDFLSSNRISLTTDAFVAQIHIFKLKMSEIVQHHPVDFLHSVENVWNASCLFVCFFF